MCSVFAFCEPGIFLFFEVGFFDSRTVRLSEKKESNITVNSAARKKCAFFELSS